jgi:hypothetical protein
MMEPMCTGGWDEISLNLMSKHGEFEQFILFGAPVR